MTTVHIDLRELSGLPADAPIEETAWISFAPAYMVHVEDGDDYLLTLNELEVKIIDGVATVDLPPTEVGNAMVARENKFEGSRVKYLLIPDQADVDYGDLQEIDPETLQPSDEPDPAWWAELDQQVVGGEVVGDDLILERRNLTTFNAGDVRGPEGPQGPPGSGDTTGYIYPETYGAVGDGTTDDTTAVQDAIDAAEADGGGVVWFNPSKHYRASLILKEGVLLNGGGDGVKWAGGPHAARISPPTGWAGGWVIDTPATQIMAAGVIGLTVSGNVATGADPDTGGIRIQDGVWVTIESCSVSSVSLGAVYCEGTANIIRNNALTNFWQFRGTLTADEGTLHVVGTDAWIEGNQCNGGMSVSDTIDTDLADLHKCAVLLSLYSSWIVGGNGEFAEIGWKVSLYMSSVWGMRGDTNLGPGIYVVPSLAGSTLYSDTVLIRNCASPSAHLVYAQMYISDYANVFDGVSITGDGAGFIRVATYGIFETTDYIGFSANALQQYANKFNNIKSGVGAWRNDELVRTNSAPRASYRRGGAGDPSGRPPSRFSAGQTWWDTVGNKLTISDGVNWRDTANAIVGSLILPKVAYSNDGVIHFDPVGATSTLATVFDILFGAAVMFELTTTAAGVTAGYASMATKAADYVPVVAGTTYKLAARASGPSGKSPKMGLSIQWLTAGAVPISTSVMVADTTAIAAVGAAPTLLLSAGVAAPATAAFANIIVIGKDTGLASGDKFRVGGFSLVIGSAMTDLNET